MGGLQRRWQSTPNGWPASSLRYFCGAQPASCRVHARSGQVQVIVTPPLWSGPGQTDVALSAAAEEVLVLVVRRFSGL